MKESDFHAQQAGLRQQQTGSIGDALGRAEAAPAASTPPHVLIRDEVVGLQEINQELEKLIAEIAHTDLTDEPAGVDKTTHSLSEVLNETPGMIKNSRNQALDLINRIRGLLFNLAEDK